MYQSSLTFNLEDPNIYLWRPEYNSLHDENLRDFYQNPQQLRRLKNNGELLYGKQVGDNDSPSAFVDKNVLFILCCQILVRFQILQCSYY